MLTSVSRPCCCWAKWASWCEPCVEEIPEIVKVYQKYHPRGFEVLGISLDEENQAEAVRKFAAAHRTVALRKRLRAALGRIRHDQAERHVGGDHLPGRA